jgi:hypothetical protein
MELLVGTLFAADEDREKIGRVEPILDQNRNWPPGGIEKRTQELRSGTAGG